MTNMLDITSRLAARRLVHAEEDCLACPVCDGRYLQLHHCASYGDYGGRLAEGAVAVYFFCYGCEAFQALVFDCDGAGTAEGWVPIEKTATLKDAVETVSAGYAQDFAPATCPRCRMHRTEHPAGDSWRLGDLCDLCSLPAVP